MRITNWPSHLRLFVLFMLAGMVLSCVKPLSNNWDPQAYTVKRGDTLYSIAWRYEKDFRSIAQWNGISAPYQIHPGQRLSMVAANASGTMDSQQAITRDISRSDNSVQFAKKPVSVHRLAEPADSKAFVVKEKPGSVKVKKGDTLYSIARSQGLSPKQLARWNALSAPYAIYPGKKLRLKPAESSKKWAEKIAKKPETKGQSGMASVSNSKKSKKTTQSLPKRVKKWLWPADGKLVKTFKATDTNRKGIGIAGYKGQTIKAAASGKVVYSGNGLIHYGNLLIIKHSGSFLSAYAHNRSLLVKEGDHVHVGQHIAQMGTIENGRARLHFEIRKNGKPVNPLTYMPKRKG